jgi:hypothetical protein
MPWDPTPTLQMTFPTPNLHGLGLGRWKRIGTSMVWWSCRRNLGRSSLNGTESKHFLFSMSHTLTVLRTTHPIINSKDHVIGLLAGWLQGAVDWEALCKEAADAIEEVCLYREASGPLSRSVSCRPSGHSPWKQHSSEPCAVHPSDKLTNLWTGVMQSLQWKEHCGPVWPFGNGLLQAHCWLCQK